VRTTELARRAAVNPQTLRYYERRGLLAEPARTPAGYRTYPVEAVRRVRFIKQAQQHGFTLAQVQTLLHLGEDGPDGCDQVRALAEDTIADLHRRIADLQALQAGLTRLADSCRRPHPQRDCPLLHQLDPPGTDRRGDGCDR
jgi:DNA-binding transcriptional MerR regulator